MPSCIRCQASIPEDARFCPQCGTKQPKDLSCPRCGASNPTSARFCKECGLSFVDPPPGNASKTAPSWTPQRIADAFFRELEAMVAREQDISRWALYLERFHNCGFKPTFERRVTQLAEEANTIAREQVRGAKAAKDTVQRELFNLCDFFTIRHCNDLNVVPLPEKILRYQNANLHTVNWTDMLLDYLDWTQESEPIYTDFLKMPVDLLRNASASFLFAEKDERLLLLCDLSVLGTLKEGFALTNRAVYWKSPLQKPQSRQYAQLKDLQREKDWITIDGLYFHANPSLDVKLLKLLDKIRRLFEKGSGWAS